jgi:hypothetical protein
MYRLTIDGNRLYGSTPLGTLVVDISEPSQMRVVTLLDPAPGPAISVLSPGSVVVESVVRQDFALTVRALNVQDILEPVEVWSGPGFYAAALSPYVYSITTSGTVPRIIVSDFSDPAHPVEVGAVEGTSVALSAHGNVLVSCNAYTQWQYDFFDITDRTAPRLSFSTSTNFSVSDLTFDGNYAYVFGWNINSDDSVQVIDISDPSRIQTIAEWQMQDWGITRQILDMTVANGLAIISVDEMGFKVFDVTDLAQPRDLGAFQTNQSWPQIPRLVGKKLFVAGSEALTCYDMTDPRDPKVLGALSFDPAAVKVKKSGSRLFVQRTGAGIQALDVTDPQAPREIPTRLPEALSIEVLGSTVYMLDHESSFKVFNVSDPSNPQLLGALALSGRSSGNFAIAGGLAFVDVDNFLGVIDITTPSSMTVRTNVGPVSRWSPPKVFQAADLVYALGSPSTGTGMLLSVIDGRNAELLSQTKIEGYGGFGVVGSVVYIGRTIYDCSDPRTPTVKGQLPVYVGATALGRNNRLYTFTYIGTVNSLAVLDVTDPLSPKLLSTTPASPDNPVADGDFLYTTSSGYVTIFQTDGEVPTSASLNVTPFGETHRVSWPSRFQSFKLLTAPSPSGPWSPNTRAITTNYYSFENEVVVPSRGPAAFYRLEEPR